MAWAVTDMVAGAGIGQPLFIQSKTMLRHVLCGVPGTTPPRARAIGWLPAASSVMNRLLVGLPLMTQPFCSLASAAMKAVAGCWNHHSTGCVTDLLAFAGSGPVS